mmetsp:Transcript_14527/g.37062  ORF Transcript_14527/g.37062 Transcript_14527/m.37062 type:complete len:289 (-) Transcript_14527:143-1009(-)
MLKLLVYHHQLTLQKSALRCQVLHRVFASPPTLPLRIHRAPVLTAVRHQVVKHHYLLIASPLCERGGKKRRRGGGRGGEGGMGGRMPSTPSFTTTTTTTTARSGGRCVVHLHCLFVLDRLAVSAYILHLFLFLPCPSFLFFFTSFQRDALYFVRNEGVVVLFPAFFSFFFPFFSLSPPLFTSLLFSFKLGEVLLLLLHPPLHIIAQAFQLSLPLLRFLHLHSSLSCQLLRGEGIRWGIQHLQHYPHSEYEGESKAESEVGEGLARCRCARSHLLLPLLLSAHTTTKLG